MKVLLLCGYFAKENEQEVIEHARANVEFSANEFQRKLIRGLQAQTQDLYVLSAPFIGSYPNASSIRVFRGFREKQNICQYVPFNNIWGLRNFSRANQLKRAIRFFIEMEDPDKRIIVYCAHTPFLEAAAWAKKKDPRIHIHFYVPDLPAYMNLNANRSKLYDVAKAYDIAAMERYMKAVDSFALLTEPMKDCLPVGNKPYFVAEGILERERLKCPAEESSGEDVTYIVYTGKMNEKFGIPALVEGFSQLPHPEFRLVLCGDGDCMTYVRNAAKKDSRILVQGQVTPDQAVQWQKRAAVLVNPRPDNETYTKYSFPSKNIEYLLTGKPVVACMLKGMPCVYRDFIYEIAEDSPGAIALALQNAACAQPGEVQEKYQSFRTYAEKYLDAEEIALRILKIRRFTG